VRAEVGGADATAKRDIVDVEWTFAALLRPIETVECTMKAYLTLEHGQQSLGILHIDLFDQTVPKTVTNFVTLLQRPDGKGYRGCTFHRIIKGFMAQGGDFTAGDGTGGMSIYEKGMFPDENFTHSHVRAGTLSMANSGPHTNGSQFFITFKATPHLNRKHVVFGQIDLTQSADVLDALERIPTQPHTNRPRQPVTIVDCGIVSENSSQVEKVANPSSVEDQDEIDIDDIVEVSHPSSEKADDDPVEDAVDDDKPALTKAEAIKQRLRKLKQKMNQARQLNKQAVQEEGQRIADPEKERRRLASVAKQAKQAAWEATNAKALAISSETGVDAKALTEPGADSVRMARVKADKSKLNRFQINDYHNPESQHRNYQRNLKSIPSSSVVGSQSRTTDADNDFGDDAMYNPLDSLTSISGASSSQHEREGARRIASELHRRIEKRQERDRKRKQNEIQSGAADEASGINDRNKRFNQKINRTYDKQTAEIRQNLERGTAL
jgi:cyclophilin family peptidyl-prolyl cis-trans isomerase